MLLYKLVKMKNDNGNDEDDRNNISMKNSIMCKSI